jgi:hypothetical protein
VPFPFRQRRSSTISIHNPDSDEVVIRRTKVLAESSCVFFENVNRLLPAAL